MTSQFHSIPFRPTRSRRAARGAHPDDVMLESVATELLFHCVKIFAIVSCVVEGGASPSLGTPKNPLQVHLFCDAWFGVHLKENSSTLFQSITNPSLSPIKKKVGIGSSPPQNTFGEKQQSLQSSPSLSSPGTGRSQGTWVKSIFSHNIGGKGCVFPRRAHTLHTIYSLTKLVSPEMLQTFDATNL